jgi:aminoglycoside phosphotransferase
VSWQDGHEIVVRVPSSLVQDSRAYRQGKLFREAEMLRWMSSCTTIPVPRVIQDATELSTPFLATTKCEGEPLVWAFGGLSDSAQVRTSAKFA